MKEFTDEELELMEAQYDQMIQQKKKRKSYSDDTDAMIIERQSLLTIPSKRNG